ncbi:DNA polymerase epsilon subunit 2 [Scaptodrosophila lebanonensis]|uniref:DNA polymerase epsilon subunit n=1 Tax=Drosophila lebanonensis TaxID=7225 RepID=A0A6J2UDK1_DROLE|nr:DNA polymerase epsilon subunit 2 [Scaptodrosophila lebanonensis]XP_030385503.1 DNA polymerase epsilon subunit 2 [Scaptodrosophila lebanonensis]
MDELARLRKRITTSFKLSGFIIRSENSTFLAEQLLPFDATEREKWLTIIAENLQGQKLSTPHVERNALEKAINELNRVGLDEGETVFSLIDAFCVPRYRYNLRNKKFDRDTNSRQLLTQPRMKSDYMQQRYSMLLQKTLRHDLFAPPVIQDGVSVDALAKKFKLQYAENLLATSTVKEAVVLGLLTQLKEGKFYVEDPTGCVELDLSGARFHAGFFCEGCFVLAEGSYANGVLKVDGLGFPPAEPASSSRAFFGTANTWGGESAKLLKYSPRLQEMERSNTETTMVFLSDVRLDMPVVMEKLRQLFVGYDNCPPQAIVLMGPFAASTRSHHELRHHLDALGALAAGCEQLKKQSDLILVPSCEDPTAPNILPRAPLPECLAVGLRKLWPRTQLATNPCRLQYCTQQIVVCRLDLMAKFCRNTLHFPTDTSHIEQHFSRTLICQGHLVPIHPIAMPVHWDYDPALWLYPLPDLIVMGDACQSFSSTQHGCTVLNTGSFVKSKFAFKVYIPSTRTIEDSEIPSDMDLT